MIQSTACSTIGYNTQFLRFVDKVALGINDKIFVKKEFCVCTKKLFYCKIKVYFTY